MIEGTFPKGRSRISEDRRVVAGGQLHFILFFYNLPPARRIIRVIVGRNSRPAFIPLHKIRSVQDPNIKVIEERPMGDIVSVCDGLLFQVNRLLVIDGGGASIVAADGVERIRALLRGETRDLVLPSLEDPVPEARKRINAKLALRCAKTPSDTDRDKLTNYALLLVRMFHDQKTYALRTTDLQTAKRHAQWELFPLARRCMEQIELLEPPTGKGYAVGIRQYIAGPFAREIAALLQLFIPEKERVPHPHEG